MEHKYPKFHNEYEDDQWRKLANRQALNRKIILIIGIVALLIWIFNEAIGNYWKSLSWSQLQNKKTPITTPQIIPPNSIMPELQFPESGSTIQYQHATGTTANFTVISGEGKTENCIVKLETWNEGLPIVELFIRAGEKAETSTIPLNSYRIKYACGNQWYGRSEMFGRGTQISIGIQPLQFWQSGNTIHGNILTLTKKVNGNFKTNDSYLNKF